MKTLRFLILALLFASFSAESYAIIDDCPCRKKVVKKQKEKAEKKIVHVWKVPVNRFTIFDSLIVPPEDLGCRKQECNRSKITSLK